MLGGFDNPSRYALRNNGGKQFEVRFSEFYRRSVALRWLVERYNYNEG